MIDRVETGPVFDEWVEQTGDLFARCRRHVYLDLHVPGEVIGRAPGTPEVNGVGVAVADGANDVTGVLLSDLLADLRVLLPRCRYGVAEFLHQRRVVPKDVGGDVVAQAINVAVRSAHVQRVEGPLVDL